MHSLFQKVIRGKHLCRNGGLTHAGVHLRLPFISARRCQIEGERYDAGNDAGEETEEILSSPAGSR
jgi:hypothetical protein